MLQLQATGELTENNLFVISSVILLISKPLRKRNLGKESKFGTFSRDPRTWHATEFARAIALAPARAQPGYRERRDTRSAYIR